LQLKKLNEIIVNLAKKSKILIKAHPKKTTFPRETSKTQTLSPPLFFFNSLDFTNGDKRDSRLARGGAMGHFSP
jgi:hypothetical protein